MVVRWGTCTATRASRPALDAAFCGMAMSRRMASDRRPCCFSGVSVRGASRNLGPAGARAGAGLAGGPGGGLSCWGAAAACC